jgi:thioredoxin 1
VAEPIIVGEQTFDDVVLKSTVPVLVDFWAVWCGPCRAVAPILDELAKEYDGKLLIAKLNVDDEPAIAARYKITSIPTMKIFVNGREEKNIIGAMPKAAIVQKFAEYIPG